MSTGEIISEEEAKKKMAAGTACRPLTFGEKAVGLTFNPGGDQLVSEIKEKYARIIDLLDNERNKCTTPGRIRHFSLAITEAEDAQMRAVKAITWKD